MNELERRRAIDERTSGSWWGWWWVWIVIFFFFAFWFAGWGWGSYGGWWWGRPRTVAVQPSTQQNNGGPATGAYGPNGGNAANGQSNNAMNSSGTNNSAVDALLAATNKRQYVGQTMQLNGVQVQRKISSNVFWVGNNNQAPTLVVLNQQGNTSPNNNIQQGDTVNIAGRVEAAPNAGTATRDWHLNQQAAQRLEQEGAFLQASSVAVAQ